MVAVQKKEIRKAPSNWNAIAAMTLTVSGLIIAEFLPAGVITPIAEDLSISKGTAGQAVTATSIFAVATSLLIAYLTRKWNRKRVLLGLTVFLTISSIIVALATNFAFLLVGRIFLGIALGGFWSMAAAIAIRLVSEESVPKALAIIFGGSSFSSMLAAPLGSYLGDVIGWRNVFLLAAFFGIASFVWQWIALPKLEPAATTKLSTTIDVLKAPMFGTGLFAVLCIFGGRFALFTYLRPTLESIASLSVNQISGVLLIFGFAYFAGNWFSTPFIKKDIVQVLRFTPVVSTFVAFGMLLFSGNIFIFMLLVFLWGLSFGPSPVAWSTWLTKRVPEYAETAGGLYVASIQLAAGIGATIGGFTFDQSGSDGIFIVSGMAWIVAGAIIFAFIRHTRQDRFHKNEFIEEYIGE